MMRRGCFRSTCIIVIDNYCSVTIAFDYAYIVYQNCNCTSFFKNGNWNTDGTAKPDFDWTGIVFDIFIMWPTFQQINENAIQPLDNGDITIEEALKEAEVPIRQFMYGQVQRKDVKLFVDMAGDSYDIDSLCTGKGI